MKLVQANIWGGKLLYVLQDFFNKVEPDIVCLQEVHDLPGGPSGALFVTLDELKEQCGYPESFMSPLHSFHFMNRDLNYGNAILSKSKLALKETIFTKGVYQENYDVTTHHESRNFQHAVVEKDGKKLHIINHHGEYVDGTKMGNANTQGQMKQISDYIAQLEGAVILTGDLNLQPESPSLQPLDALLRNLPVEYKVKSTYNFFSDKTIICDYIFVNDQVTVNSFEVAEDIVSDHKALILDFDF